MSKKMQMKLVNGIVKKIHDDLNGRSGIDISSGALGKDIASEIVAEHTIIVWDALKKAGVFGE